MPTIARHGGIVIAPHPAGNQLPALPRWRRVQADRPFETFAVVLLPEHLHCVWRLPEGDDDYPTRWRLIKWPYSTFRRFVAAGEYDEGWGETEPESLTGWSGPRPRRRSGACKHSPYSW